MIYLLTAIFWTSVGNSTIHIYTQTIQRTTQLYTLYRTEHNLLKSQATEIIKIFPTVFDALIKDKLKEGILDIRYCTFRCFSQKSECDCCLGHVRMSIHPHETPIGHLFKIFLVWEMFWKTMYTKQKKMYYTVIFS